MRILLCTIVTSLTIAAPALAQSAPEPICLGTNDIGDPVACPQDSGGTVGDGQVITDPADEIDQSDSGPMRGEVHVLSDTRSSNVASHQPAAPHAAAPQAAAPQPAPASSYNTPILTKTKTLAAHQKRRPHGKRELPFTGVDVWMLVLGGLFLLEAGIRLRRVTNRLAPETAS
jgi:hypothetical protein